MGLATDRSLPVTRHLLQSCFAICTSRAGGYCLLNIIVQSIPQPSSLLVDRHRTQHQRVPYNSAAQRSTAPLIPVPRILFIHTDTYVLYIHTHSHGTSTHHSNPPSFSHLTEFVHSMDELIQQAQLPKIHFLHGLRLGCLEWTIRYQPHAQHRPPPSPAGRRLRPCSAKRPYRTRVSYSAPRTTIATRCS